LKAAIVFEPGRPPVYGEFRDPIQTPHTSLIRVTATSLSRVTKSRALGTHYSSRGQWPFVPGIDGVGIDEEGRRVYFFFPEAPFGAMAERCLVDKAHHFFLPDGISDVSAAAMAVPGMSSWAALVERAKMRPGETVLINGATGASGRLAIQIAKHLGAKKVIATGRQVEAFAGLRLLGADATIALVQEKTALENALREEFQQGVDIVLDYLWGPSAEALLSAGALFSPEGVPLRYVQIGSVSGETISLPAAVLRSSSLELMGSGMGSLAPDQIRKALQGVLEAASDSHFQIATDPVPLAELASVWEKADQEARIVFLTSVGATPTPPKPQDRPSRGT